MSAAPIYVVVCTYGAPPDCTRPDGTRYSPIVMETDVDTTTQALAQARAARLERQGFGACRVGRVVFENEPGFDNACTGSNDPGQPRSAYPAIVDWTLQTR